MIEKLDVFLDEVPCGSLEQQTGGSLRFDYDDDYRESRQATGLSLSMPLIRKSHKNRPTRAFLGGLAE